MTRIRDAFDQEIDLGERMQEIKKSHPIEDISRVRTAMLYRTVLFSCATGICLSGLAFSPTPSPHPLHWLFLAWLVFAFWVLTRQSPEIILGNRWLAGKMIYAFVGVAGLAIVFLPLGLPLSIIVNASFGIPFALATRVAL